MEHYKQMGVSFVHHGAVRREGPTLERYCARCRYWVSDKMWQTHLLRVHKKLDA